MRARAKGATPTGAAAWRLPMDPGPPIHATGLAAVTGPIPGTDAGIANVSACSPEPATGSPTGLSYSAMQVSTLSGSLAAGGPEGARDPGVHPVGLRQRPACLPPGPATRPASMTTRLAPPSRGMPAIPLATMTGGRVTYLHELMDSAHDAPEIHRHGEQSGHVPIIDVNPRRDRALKEIREMEPKARANVNIPDPRAIRYNNRSTVERVNARLKDEFGGRHVRVRGHAKVFAHIMFGVLALAIDQLQRYML